MRIQLSILALLSIICMSCVGHTNSETIDLDKTSEVSVNDFFDSIKVIQLETSEESLFSEVYPESIKLFEDKIFVLDTKIQSILCFNAYGKFLYKIAKKGRGPDEYSYIGSINIDTYNKHLLLLEPFGVLHRYDFSGNFLSKIYLPTEGGAYNEVYALNKDSLVFQSLNKFKVLYYSTVKNQLYKKMFPSPPLGGCCLESMDDISIQ